LLKDKAHPVNCQEADRRQSQVWIRTQEKTMFAVIKTGGKQYSVTAGDIITVMALDGAPGDSVTFNEVLMLAGDGAAKIGAPIIQGAVVKGEIAEQARSPKTIAFKKRRRQNSKRKRGHRQDLTRVKITAVEG
jgi:large subunit ribosomal protein L21